jgi:hypothetical protein
MTQRPIGRYAAVPSPPAAPGRIAIARLNVYVSDGCRADRIVNDARMTFSYYVSDHTLGTPRSADDTAFIRWLCSCGSGGYALDIATFAREVLSHLRYRHGSTIATAVGTVERCSAELLAFIERRILG